jgi:uncharacterized protein YfcZ (UPF0381/DUF406 family)
VIDDATDAANVEQLGRQAEALEKTIAELTARATAGELAGHELARQVAEVGHRLVSLRTAITILFDELERGAA